MNKIYPVVMDNNFNRLAVIDDYVSLIWTSRYYSAGDFELCVAVTPENMTLFSVNYYICRDDDENVGLVENIKIQRTEDGQELLIVTGRFIVALLGRRIIAKQTTVSGTISNCINQLLYQNVIEPSLDARRISNFNVGYYSISQTMQAQYTGKNLLETICAICETYKIGLKCTLDSSNNFIFELYEGVDRTYNQAVNSWVIFSDKFDNLLSSSYEENYSSIATAVLVAGEGEGLDRKTAWVSSSYEEIGSNILSNTDVSAYNLSAYNYTDGVYTCTKTANYGGLQINTTDLLTAGDVYVVKYKIQKTSGELISIGGHNAAFTQYTFTVDGNSAGSYQNGYVLSDDTNVHEVIYTGRFSGTGSNLNFYIQPNRGTTTEVSFKVTDLEIYTSQGTIGLDRYEVYKDQRNLQSNDGEISDQEYQALMQESGEESLSKYTTAFTGTVYFDNIKFKEDVNLGDICVIENSRWGIRVNSRLVEVIESVNESGDYSIVPTFGL